MQKRKKESKKSSGKADPKATFSNRELSEPRRGIILEFWDDNPRYQKDKEWNRVTLIEGQVTNQFLGDEGVSHVKVRLVSIVDEAQMPEEEAKLIVSNHFECCTDIKEDGGQRSKMTEWEHGRIDETEDRIIEALRLLSLEAEIPEYAKDLGIQKFVDVLTCISEYSYYESVRECAREKLKTSKQ